MLLPIRLFWNCDLQSVVIVWLLQYYVLYMITLYLKKHKQLFHKMSKVLVVDFFSLPFRMMLSSLVGNLYTKESMHGPQRYI